MEVYSIHWCSGRYSIYKDQETLMDGGGPPTVTEMAAHLRSYHQVNEYAIIARWGRGLESLHNSLLSL